MKPLHDVVHLRGSCGEAGFVPSPSIISNCFQIRRGETPDLERASSLSLSPHKCRPPSRPAPLNAWADANEGMEFMTVSSALDVSRE
ncbi:hypothetical protein GCG54_00002993 [Colletotrichum gloeosporioides]|uniref:Uncharacterized protein n=1 Tax=Colletotrichum gloeosporioides TaxID=474922 RepID=A0A8H4FQN4_COLGL|nr:uncharacterized protein GCG54_00002993 [Colletotrichum gloeosporioides]KAF3810816.1 hypothetical protein GCG54_00002993 [Colletotrichum gloeosporioides]